MKEPIYDYVIISDGNCDLTLEQAQALGVGLLPMPFMVDGVAFTGERESSMDPEEFYRRMREGAVTKTTQKSPHDYKEAFRPHLEAGKAILSVSMASILSATYNSSLIAREELLEEFPNATIICIDSELISLAQGMLVELIARRRAAGDSIQKVAAFAEEFKKHICVYLTVDNLKYLHRGGRLSGTSAMMGTLMSIKPILRINGEGRLVAHSKVRGRKQSLDTLVKIAQEHFSREYYDKIYLLGSSIDDELRSVGEALKKSCGTQNVELATVGFSVGCHAGPGVVGLTFTARSRE